MTDTKPVNLDELDEIFNASTQGEWVATDSFGVWLGPLKENSPGSVRASAGSFQLLEADHWDYEQNELEDSEEDVEEKARANEACVAALHNNYKALAEELRALRVRVGELEEQNATLAEELDEERACRVCGDRARGNDGCLLCECPDPIATKTIQLREAEARAESAEARVRELEAKAHERDQALCEYERALVHGSYAERSKAMAFLWDKFARGHLHFWEYLDEEARYGVLDLRDAIERSATARTTTTLESQLEAAREEQGLEAKVREVLGERFEWLKLERMWVNGELAWFADTRLVWPHHSFVSAPTLPALLRAILEVEARGG